MDIRVNILILLLLIIIIGLIKKVYIIKNLINKYNFINTYSNKVNDLLNKKINDEDYTYIFSNINKVSNTLGKYGVLESYKPPFANYYYQKYNLASIIINHQPGLTDQELLLGLKMFQIYLGSCDEKINKLKNDIKNPLALFAAGFRFILNIPMFILKSLGLISNKIYYKIQGNYIYYFIQNIIVLLGLISAIITIIQGKDIVYKIQDRIVHFITSTF